MLLLGVVNTMLHGILLTSVSQLGAVKTAFLPLLNHLLYKLFLAITACLIVGHWDGLTLDPWQWMGLVGFAMVAILGRFEC